MVLKLLKPLYNRFIYYYCMHNLKKTIFLLAAVMLVYLAACSKAQINNFEECAAAGNPVMESYPRQCSADGRTFTEELNFGSISDLKQNSEFGSIVTIIGTI